MRLELFSFDFVEFSRIDLYSTLFSNNELAAMQGESKWAKCDAMSVLSLLSTTCIMGYGYGFVTAEVWWWLHWLLAEVAYYTRTPQFIHIHICINKYIMHVKTIAVLLYMWMRCQWACVWNGNIETYIRIHYCIYVYMGPRRPRWKIIAVEGAHTNTRTHTNTCSYLFKNARLT